MEWFQAIRTDPSQVSETAHLATTSLLEAPQAARPIIRGSKIARVHIPSCRASHRLDLVAQVCHPSGSFTSGITRRSVRAIRVLLTGLPNLRSGSEFPTSLRGGGSFDNCRWNGSGRKLSSPHRNLDRQMDNEPERCGGVTLVSRTCETDFCFLVVPFVAAILCRIGWSPLPDSLLRLHPHLHSRRYRHISSCLLCWRNCLVSTPIPTALRQPPGCIHTPCTSLFLLLLLHGLLQLLRTGRLDLDRAHQRDDGLRLGDGPAEIALSARRVRRPLEQLHGLRWEGVAPEGSYACCEGGLEPEHGHRQSKLRESLQFVASCLPRSSEQTREHTNHTITTSPVGRPCPSSAALAPSSP
uniref:Uncharacterized protein n=1 Tax=Auxenochlorella protothecoides TaxID=3075 RepID=A0A1D1ZP87_AUXPR